MSLEVKLFKLLMEKEAYNRFNGFIKPHAISKEGKDLLKDLGKFYEVSEEFDVDKFIEWSLTTQKLKFSVSEAEVYDLYVRRIYTSDIPDPVIVSNFIERDYFIRIASLCIDAEENPDISMEDIQKLVDKCYVEVGRADPVAETLYDVGIADLFSDAALESGYSWRLPELRGAVGDIRDKQLVVIGGRPNCGKTSMLASEASYLAAQLPEGKNLVWINNEGPPEDVKIRIVTACLGVSEEYAKKHAEECAEEWDRLMQGKLRLHNGVTDVHSAVKIFEADNPGLIVIDQLWNFAGFDKSGNESVRQGCLFTTARKWAAKYAPVLAVHQLSGEYEGVAYPTMDAFHQSRTAIQGAADVVIMLGKRKEPEFDNVRFLNVVKTKRRVGKELFSTKYREFELLFDEETGRFSSEYKY